MNRILALIWIIIKGALKKSAIISAVIAFLQYGLPTLKAVFFSGGAITEMSLMVIVTLFASWFIRLLLPCCLLEYILRQYIHPTQEWKKYKP